MRQKGFTLVEMLLVLAIIGTLLAVTTVSLSNVQQSSYVSSSLETLLSDIKLQQTKAMNGDTNGTATAERYGVHFETYTYTLFYGDTYNAVDPTNFVVSLEGNAYFSAITWPNAEIVFEKGSGEIVGYTPGNDSVTLQNEGGSDPALVTLNGLGVFTQIQ